MLKQIDFYLSIIYYRVPFILVAILPYVYKCNEFSQRIDRSIDRFLRNSKTRKACHGYGHGYYCRTMIHPAIICLARNLRPSYLSNVKQIRRMDFYDGRNPADRVGVGRTMEGNVRVKDINSDRHCVRTYIYTYVCVTWCVCVCVFQVYPHSLFFYLGTYVNHDFTSPGTKKYDLDFCHRGQRYRGKVGGAGAGERREEDGRERRERFVRWNKSFINYGRGRCSFYEMKKKRKKKKEKGKMEEKRRQKYDLDNCRTKWVTGKKI